MTQPIKVGFIGLSATGWAATALGPSLLQPSLKGKYDLVAVSTTSEESAKASAEKHAAQVGHPIKAYHGDSSQIASDPDVDLVVVSVKAPLHKQVVLPVIEKKKNFFIEWPAGTGLKETLEIAEAAHRNGVKSFVGLQARSSPVIKKVKELIDSGVIGTVRSTTFIGLFPREPNFFPPLISPHALYATKKGSGVSAFSIAGGHDLDPLTYILGEFATINATATTIYPTATVLDAQGNPTDQTVPAIVPDHYSISGLLKSGALATIVWRAGYKSTPGRKHLLWEIDGEDGSIRLEHDTSAFINLFYPTLYLNGEKVEVDGTASHTQHVLGSALEADGPTSQTLHILGNAWDAYADGKEGQYPTIDDAVKNQRFVDAVERSLAEGKTIVL